MNPKVKTFLLAALIGLIAGSAGMALYDYVHRDSDVVEMVDGHPAVDLGLSVRWAEMNLGAEDALDPGTGLSFPDAEQASWGGKWRMPTSEDWRELFSKCTLMKYDGGYALVGPNGKNLYLPKINGSQVAVYWSSTPSSNFYVTEGTTQMKGNARDCLTISDSLYLLSFPIPDQASTIATRLVCE